MEEYKGSPAHDAGLLAAAQAVEHYEITRYGTLRTWAEELGHDEAVTLLQETLDEEEATDEALTSARGIGRQSAGRSGLIRDGPRDEASPPGLLQPQNPASAGFFCQKCRSFRLAIRRDAIHIPSAGWRIVWPGKVLQLRDRGGESEKITINLGYVDLGRIDLLVQEGFYSNRTDFIRTAIRNQLSTQDDAVTESIVRHTLGTRAARLQSG